MIVVYEINVEIDDSVNWFKLQPSTGSPKPVIIQQIKVCVLGNSLAVCDFCAEGTVYTVLPVYHSAGGGIGLCSVINTGCLFRSDKSDYWGRVHVGNQF